MSLSLSNDSKNALSITNESKETGLTWDEADFIWNEAAGTWDVPGLPLIKETKNTLSITYENKN